MSQRACERIFGVSNKTVAKLFEEAGDMAISHVANLKNLEIKKIQADELHSFVAIREGTLNRMLESDGEVRDDAGTVWAYLAMCADSKLVFAYKLGDQTVPDARAFFKGVAKKLKRSDQGGFAVKPSIVTDGLKAYEQAYKDTFGTDATFSRIVKSYSNADKNGQPTRRSRFTGSKRENVEGVTPDHYIHTNYIERQNLNLRMQNRRYTRRSNAFSKKLLNHERHLALWMMFHNYCWIPRPKRPTQAERADGSNRWHKRETAALAAGLTKKLWTIEDLLDATDKFVAERKLKAAKAVADAEAAPPPAPPVNDDGEVQDFTAPFWAYRSFHNGQPVKVHKASCSNCRDGQGRKRGAATSGEWTPFQSLEAADAFATAIDPNEEVQCSMCLTGRYRSRVGLREVRHGNPRRN